MADASAGSLRASNWSPSQQRARGPLERLGMEPLEAKLRYLPGRWGGGEISMSCLQKSAQNSFWSEILFHSSRAAPLAQWREAIRQSPGSQNIPVERRDLFRQLGRAGWTTSLRVSATPFAVSGFSRRLRALRRASPSATVRRECNPAGPGARATGFELARRFPAAMVCRPLRQTRPSAFR
jgi:hypothetical protein